MKTLTAVEKKAIADLKEEGKKIAEKICAILNKHGVADISVYEHYSEIGEHFTTRYHDYNVASGERELRIGGRRDEVWIRTSLSDILVDFDGNLVFKIDGVSTSSAMLDKGAKLDYGYTYDLAFASLNKYSEVKVYRKGPWVDTINEMYATLVEEHTKTKTLEDSEELLRKNTEKQNPNETSVIDEIDAREFRNSFGL
ncbi:MAG: hypothetical protein KGH58_00420 [Candidatus Micrarchaeota archaeon]|nr:hypothetical protein [Candidatus Micrarchaeota archaeon]